MKNLRHTWSQEPEMSAAESPLISPRGLYPMPCHTKKDVTASNRVDIFTSIPPAAFDLRHSEVDIFSLMFEQYTF